MRPGCWLLSFKSLGFLPKPVIRFGTVFRSINFFPRQVTHEDFNMDLFLENEEFPFRHLSFTRIYHTCGVWWSQVPVIFASGMLGARPCCSAFSFGSWWNHWWKRHQIWRTPHSPTRFHGHLQVRFDGFAMANFWSRLFLLVCIFSWFLSHSRKMMTRWWFQIFFIFSPTWGRFPFWRAYFSNGLAQPPTRWKMMKHGIEVFVFWNCWTHQTSKGPFRLSHVCKT